MGLDLNQVRLLFMHELRSLLRDRRTLFFAVLLPLLIMPVMIFSGRFVEESTRAREEARTYSYAVVGDEATLARELIAQGLAIKTAASEEERRAAASEADTARHETARDGDEAPEAWNLEEVEVEDPAPSLEAEELDFYLVALAVEDAEALRDSLEALEAEAEAEAPSSAAEGDGAESGGDVAAGGPAAADADTTQDAIERVPTPLFQVYFRGNRHASRTGAGKIQEVLVAARDHAREAVLAERGLEVRFEDVFTVDASSVAETGQVAGSALGRYLTLLVVFLILAGGISVSADLMAGEKERGTLETLLTSAIGRAEIIAGKVLLVTAVAVLIMLINMGNLLVYVGFGALPLPEGLAATLSPLNMIVLVLLLLPVAILLAGLLLLVSSFAKTYKESQTYFFPLQLLMIIPPLAPFLPGIELRSAIAIVPIANVSVAVREVLVGTYDWPMLALAWLVTTASAAYIVRTAGRLLASEDYILAGGVQDTRMLAGPARLARQLPLWLLGLWGAFLLINLNYPPTTDLRLQVFVNIVVLFFGASMLMVRLYRLPVREALALRAPKPIVWLGVLIGAPATLFLAQGVAQLAGTVLPVPERVVEQFANMLLPDSIPMWQLLPMLTLLPGVCEEVLFRGVFIYGFRRRLGPVALALASGIVFGLFHVELFRLAPTAFLGVVLAAVTLLTGSLLPAMLWHAINNGLGIMLTQLDLEASVVGPAALVVAGLLTVVAFAIIWAGRSVYPGLKGSRDDAP